MEILAGGEARFIAPDEVIISYGSGHGNADLDFTQATWEATIQYFRALGFKVHVVPYRER